MTYGNRASWSERTRRCGRLLSKPLAPNMAAGKGTRREGDEAPGLWQQVSLPVRLFVGLVAILLFPAVSYAEAPTPTTVGWIERVALYPGGIIVPAKVDTGAVSCSLHCPNPTMYEKDGKKWVKFQIKDAHGKDITIDQEIVGTRRIKRHYGDYQMRPVIKMGVCLGRLFRETEVNLVDRTGFEYPMLIGRNFMDKELVVNPSAKNTVEPTCRNNK